MFFSFSYTLPLRIADESVKGTAHRVARLLADHIDELERKDALLGDIFAATVGGRHD